MTTPRPIQHDVEQLRASMADRMPAEALDAFAREREGLASTGVPEDVAAPGITVEDVAVLDIHGAATTLYAALGDDPAVLILYRGAWCPYCNITLTAYQRDLLPRLDERGIGLLAVSPQAPDGSLSMQQKNDLAFSVVSDPGNAVARRLGVLTAPSDEALAVQRAGGLDLQGANADGTTTLPMPTAAILDAAHVLRWIDVHPDYTTRTEPADIVSALDELRL